MNLEIQQNFSEKLRLVNLELLESLDQDIKKMLAEHSRDGLLGSGNTIKKTMNFISSCNSRLFQEALDHITTLNLSYYPQLETEIQEIVKNSQEVFKKEALPRLKKSTEIARAPHLYERMVPEVESAMANDHANFHNSLNANVLDLKLNSHLNPIEKALWVVEGLLLLFSMFVAGLWYKDPQGNYEPLLVALGLIIPILAIGIKLSSKSCLTNKST